MKLDCKVDDFKVRPRSRVKLKRWATSIESLTSSKKDYRSLLSDYQDEISRHQTILYAHQRYALLLIFQGMDTSGKDGAIKHVMSGVNPQGCQVYSFQQPSHEELRHDFLWRTNKRLPERGRIGIFNRSYYEELLVARVEPSVLENQRLPEELARPKTIWKDRAFDIVNMEDYLVRNGTRIVKFFLHISKEEQRRRFLARIEDPRKNWKMTRADITSRRQWEAYQEAYEFCLSATTHPAAPWHIVPADEKRNARLIVSKIVLENLESLRMKFPKPNKAQRKDLKWARRALEKELRDS